MELTFALLCLFIGPVSSMATDRAQDELIRKIAKIARDEYRKLTYKWTDYEKQLTHNMSEKEFVAYCITTARYEHRRGNRAYINWKAKIPIYNAERILVAYDYGVMQINGIIGDKYFKFLDYKNSIDDNIRAGVKHLAAGFNRAFHIGLLGLDAINYGLQFYNPDEINRIEKFWNYVPHQLRQHFTLQFSANPINSHLLTY
jgi:hypothetical protein